MRHVIFTITVAVFASDLPKPLTDAQRAEIEKARAVYWQTRTEAREAELMLIEAKRRMEEAERAAQAILAKYRVEGHQLNEALVYVPAPKRSEEKAK